VTASGEDPFIQKYLSAEKKLLDHYVHNRKVVFRSKLYKLNKDNTSELVISDERTSICGIDSFRSKGRKDYKDKQDQWVVGQLSGGLSIPGDGYSLTQGDSPDSYRISSQHPSWATERVIDSHPPPPFIYPLMYGGDDGGPYTIGHVLRHSGQATPNSAVRRTFLSATPTTWQGKPAIAVRVRSTLGDIVSTTYVDPANDYATLGFECETFDPMTRKKGIVRRMGVLTYAPSTEGIPLPGKYELWFVLPDGRKVQQGLEEFQEYSRYTPTADDFDLEKQFGVKPLPPPGTGGAAAAAGRRGWWLYAAAGVLGVITLGLVAYRWRRRVAAAA
jgi:hypothetical protein